MPVTIRIGDRQATIENGRWRSADETLARLLNAEMGPGGPAATGDPYADLTAAHAACYRHGGVILRSEIEPAREP